MEDQLSNRSFNRSQNQSQLGEGTFAYPPQQINRSNKPTLAIKVIDASFKKALSYFIEIQLDEHSERVSNYNLY